MDFQKSKNIATTAAFYNGSGEKVVHQNMEIKSEFPSYESNVQIKTENDSCLVSNNMNTETQKNPSQSKVKWKLLRGGIEMSVIKLNPSVPEPQKNLGDIQIKSESDQFSNIPDTMHINPNQSNVKQELFSGGIETALINFNRSDVTIKSEIRGNNENYRYLVNNDLGLNDEFEVKPDYVDLNDLGQLSVPLQVSEPSTDVKLEEIDVKIPVNVLNNLIKIFDCKYCLYRASTKSVLKRHITCKHPDKQESECTFCDYVASTNVVLKRHISTKHTAQKQFKCFVCDFSATTRQSLKRHVDSFHSTGEQLKCKLCDYVTTLSVNLKNHINAKHTREKEFQCEFCEYKTTCSSYLKIHTNKHTRAREFKCSFCGYSAAFYKTLMTHINAKHTRAEELRCEFCEYIGSTSHILKRHVNAKHTKEKEYQCEFCGYKTTSYSYLKVHLNKHTKVTEFKCELCDYTAAFRKTLKTHINAKHTRDQETKCGYCDYVGATPHILKRHVNAKHTGERKFECQYCGYQSTSFSYMKIHVNKHTKINEFKCDFCDYKATFRKTLMTHINAKHTREQESKCVLCPYVAATAHILKRHIKIKHSSSNPFTNENFQSFTEPDSSSLELQDTVHCDKGRFANFPESVAVKEEVAQTSEDVTKESALTKIVKKRYKCKRCSYKSRTVSFMKNHLQWHVKQPKLKCKYCEFKAIHRKNMRNHNREKHKSGKNVIADVPNTTEIVNIVGDVR